MLIPVWLLHQKNNRINYSKYQVKELISGAVQGRKWID